MNRELVARSASDKTDDWPFWMIWDQDRHLNVTVEFFPEIKGYLPFVSKENAENFIKRYYESREVDC